MDKHFSSDDLLSAIQRTKWIVDIIKTAKGFDDDLSLYRNTYRSKKGKLIHCFYAASKGEVTRLQNAAIKSCHSEINDAKDLIASKVTRSKILIKTALMLYHQIKGTAAQGEAKATSERQ
jgi:hypothetical protein